MNQPCTRRITSKQGSSPATVSPARYSCSPEYCPKPELECSCTCTNVTHLRSSGVHATPWDCHSQRIHHLFAHENLLNFVPRPTDRFIAHPSCMHGNIAFPGFHAFHDLAVVGDPVFMCPGSWLSPQFGTGVLSLFLVSSIQGSSSKTYQCSFPELGKWKISQFTITLTL